MGRSDDEYDLVHTYSQAKAGKSKTSRPAVREVGRDGAPVRLWVGEERAASDIRTPPSGTQFFFFDTSDGELKRKDSTGTVTSVGGASSNTISDPPLSTYPYPKWQMDSSSGSGSVTFTDQQIQLREPGVSSSGEESRAYDDITTFDPAGGGKVKIHLSNITIDDSDEAEITLSITDDPDSITRSGEDRLSMVARGNGEVVAFTANNGGQFFSSDSTQDNSFAGSLNSIELSWDGSSATATATDGSTTVTVSENSEYPAESLFLHIAAQDSASGSANNADYDVAGIEVGRP